MSQRKRYTKEFKLDAISLVKDQQYTQAAAAESLGIQAPMLSRWIKESEDEQSFRGNGKLTAEQLEIRQLKNKVKRLEMERELLKKATVFFAAETK